MSKEAEYKNSLEQWDSLYEEIPCKVVIREMYHYYNRHLQYAKEQSEWISVEDRPLYKMGRLGWECTRDGDGEFIAAVPYYDKNKEKDLWWIRHCVVEDGIGLCVVGDNDNDSAGWELKHVTHWQPLSKPPTP